MNKKATERPSNQKTVKSPLELFRSTYCRHCPDQDFCKVSFKQHLLCIEATKSATLQHIATIYTKQQPTPEGK